MKAIYNIILLIFVHNIVFCQIKDEMLMYDLKITYSMEYFGDSTNSNSRRSENTVLLISDGQSLFETENSHYMDSLKYILTVQPKEHKLSYFQYKIIKSSEEITTYDNTLPSRYEDGSVGLCYKENVGDLKWSLTGDTVHMGKFVCQKANVHYGNRNWTAYFDPAIPISDGPYKFAGLPGLIISIHDQKEDWRFDLVSIENKREGYQATLRPVKKYKETNKDEFFRHKRHSEENFLSLHEAKGRTPASGDQRKKLQERFQAAFKNRSNWIELY